MIDIKTLDLSVLRQNPPTTSPSKRRMTIIGSVVGVTALSGMLLGTGPLLYMMEHYAHGGTDANANALLKWFSDYPWVGMIVFIVGMITMMYLDTKERKYFRRVAHGYVIKHKTYVAPLSGVHRTLWVHGYNLQNEPTTYVTDVGKETYSKYNDGDVIDFDRKKDEAPTP